MPYTAEQVRSRHPFELLFLGVAAAQGISGLINTDFRPGSIEDGVGPTGTIIWYLAVLFSSATALIGIAWPERSMGLLLEWVGLFNAGLCTAFYGIAAIVLLGGVATYPACTLLGYALAAIWRAYQIRRFLARVAREHLNDDGE